MSNPFGILASTANHRIFRRSSNCVAVSHMISKRTQHAMTAPKALTIDQIRKEVEEVCVEVSEEQACWDFRLAKLHDFQRHQDALFGVVSQAIGTNPNGGRSPLVLTSFYLAYSTWDGRMLYLDDLGVVPESDGKVDPFAITLYVVLSRIAVRLECSRFTWQHYHEPDRLPQILNAEFMKGWLTLHWDSPSIKAFLGGSSLLNEPSANSLHETMRKLLGEQSGGGGIRLRLARASDVEAIGRLVHGLAVFEKEPDAVHVTVDQYALDGFGSHPLFYCILLEFLNNDSTWYTGGMAFCFVGVRSETGKFLYLEDLFIEELYRGKGGGTLAMKALAALALSTGCSRVVWQALDWNTPALTFYGKLGAQVQHGLGTSRLAGAKLARAAQLKLL